MIRVYPNHTIPIESEHTKKGLKAARTRGRKERRPSLLDYKSMKFNSYMMNRI